MTAGADFGERDVRHVSILDLPAAGDRFRYLHGMRLPVVLPEHGDGDLRRSRLVRSDLLLGLSHRHQLHLVSTTVYLLATNLPFFEALFSFFVGPSPLLSGTVCIGGHQLPAAGFHYLRRCCLLGLVVSYYRCSAACIPSSSVPLRQCSHEFRGTNSRLFSHWAIDIS